MSTLKTRWWVGPLTLATSLFSASAQTWNPVLPNAEYGLSGRGTAILVDTIADAPAAESVLVASDQAVYRLSPENGDWSLPPLVQALGVNTTDPVKFSSLGYDRRTDALYAVGQRPGGGAQLWTVCKSDPGDFASLYADDTFFLAKGKPSSALDFAVDSAGNAYACGWAVFGQRHWIVRRKRFGQGLWATVSDLKSKGDCIANAVTVVPGGVQFTAQDAIFVVGHANQQWTIRRSLDQGTTWFDVDARWSRANPNVIATDVAGDAEGRIYVVGHHYDVYEPAFLTGCVIRMSQTGGAPDTWETVLDVKGGAGTLGAWTLGIGASGAVTLSGAIRPLDADAPHWAIIECQSPQNTLSWVAAYESPHFPFGTLWSKGHAVGCNTTGAVFAVGEIAEPGGNNPQVGLLRKEP
ncbi:MAG: hypothetical protein JNK85_20745 [Verrucomicrobiales bacterium]|nr:hypothetical protein [Verrucomicrobiales bacterium]